MLSDVLDSIWYILSKEDNEEWRNVGLNILEYMAIKKRLTIFFKEM